MKSFIFASNILLFFFSTEALSQSFDCPNMTIKRVGVEGIRDDSFFFQNKMIILLDGICAGKEYTHTNVDNSTMNSFLSIALSAKAMGRKVNVGVNTSNQTSKSNQLSYISLGE